VAKPPKWALQQQQQQQSHSQQQQQQQQQSYSQQHNNGQLKQTVVECTFAQVLAIGHATGPRELEEAYAFATAHAHMVWDLAACKNPNLM
jgi:hypothetical protein